MVSHDYPLSVGYPSSATLYSRGMSSNRASRACRPNGAVRFRSVREVKGFMKFMKPDESIDRRDSGKAILLDVDDRRLELGLRF